MKKEKYYVVWAGVSPGIYTSWTDCQLQTKGYEGAKYKSFESREEAEKAGDRRILEVVVAEHIAPARDPQPRRDPRRRARSARVHLRQSAFQHLHGVPERVSVPRYHPREHPLRQAGRHGGGDDQSSEEGPLP